MHQYRPATKDDAALLLRWRNDPDTRRFSRNTGVVAANEHEAWLGQSLNGKDRQIWIAMQDSVPVGTVRFDYRETGREVSWTVAPEHRGKGIGRSMLQGILSIVPVPSYCEIRPTNVASILIAHAAGFRFESERDGFQVWTWNPVKS